MNLNIRLAASPEDFEVIRRMNNQVFACEIGQHEASPDGSLVDPFESRSQFLLAFDSGYPAAMVSFHDRRPFSVEKKNSPILRLSRSFPGRFLKSACSPSIPRIEGLHC